jgi:hypothetical protein
MSDRGIFVTSFLTVVLVVAGAFVLPQFFFFELVKSLIYVLIAVMVFFGEDRLSYMLGILAPPLWFVLDLVLGGFFADFGVLTDYLSRKDVPEFDTPLHGLALITEMVLVILCVRAWRKQVSGPFFGKTFTISLVISLIYVGVLAGFYVFGIPAGVGRMP